MGDVVTTAGEKRLAEAKAETKLAQMARGKRELRPAKWTGYDLPLSVRALSCEEAQACYAAALLRFDALKMPTSDVVTLPVFEDEVVLQLLHRACRDAEDPDRTFAESAEDLRSNTTPQQRGAMFELYRGVAEVGDSPASLTPAERRGIEDAIEKKSFGALKAFGCGTLATFMLTSASPPSS